MTEIETILMERDGLTEAEARAALVAAMDRVAGGDDPSEVLEEEFRLEPDYIFDLLA